ncbi:MAG TPA: hypothetical protein VGG03_00690 [Thermoanaerobaculia bacterium]|jgi:hypothetical protein
MRAFDEPWPAHPDPQALARFLRGASSRLEARVIVRHLLTGCAQCVRMTRRLWALGDEALGGPGEDRAPGDPGAVEMEGCR